MVPVFDVCPGHCLLLQERNWRTTIKGKKRTQKKTEFQSDYRGGKVAPDKAHKLFGALL